MSKLILVRHGQSIYNQKNIFTGWTDVDLSLQGEKEAKEAGELLKKNGLYPNICFTSWLKREKIFLSIRRGYDIPPPPLEIEDKKSPVFEKKYQDIDPKILPKSESLKDTKKRTVNYYYEKIVPFLTQNKTVLVSAHGNSLRSLVMEIEKMNKKDIIKFEILTGEIIVYDFDDTLKMINKTILRNEK